MRQFLCTNCKLLASVPEDQLGQPYICPGCNTRQTVPLDAPIQPIVPNTPVRPAHTLEYGSPMIPNYRMALITAWFLSIGGWIGLLRSLFTTFDSFFECATCTLLSLLVIGFGQLLHCIRDIARNSWHK